MHLPNPYEARKGADTMTALLRTEYGPSVAGDPLGAGSGMEADGSQAILDAGTAVLVRSSVSVAGVLGAVTTVGAAQTIMKDSSISSPAR